MVRQWSIWREIRLSGVGFLAEQPALPQGVVGVLDRQWFPVGGTAGPARGVGHRQVVGQRVGRPAVTGDVVGEQQQHVLVRGQADHRGPHRQFGHQVEGMPDRPGQGLAVTGGVGLHDLQHGPRGVAVPDVLVRRAVRLGEHGPQALVPLHQVVECGAQGGEVQFALQPQRQRHVVGRAGSLQPVQEPQALLREGQRQPLGPCHRHQRRAGAAAFTETRRETRDGRCFEEVADGEFGAEGGADAAEEADGGEGVSAEVEEVVVGVEVVGAEGLGEEGGEDFFVGVGGAAALGGGVGVGVVSVWGVVRCPSVVQRAGCRCG